MKTPTPFIVVTSTGDEYRLQRAFPEDRAREYAVTYSRAVDSDIPVVFGDGRRNPAPVELTAYVHAEGSRVMVARALGELEAFLADCVSLRYDDLTYPVSAAHLVSVSPVRMGYRVVVRFYGTQHDFTDADGTPVPLI